jgi:hypothetical protein
MRTPTMLVVHCSNGEKRTPGRLGCTQGKQQNGPAWAEQIGYESRGIDSEILLSNR